jgi:hypothetical protein
MARSATVLRTLIASPSDVERERETLANVIERWNAANSNSMGIMLDPIRWETHSYPATGGYPQGLINGQIVDDSDIVVAVFWSRLGTPTLKAPSGTVEEIERLRARGKRVLLYFSLTALPQDHDREQFALLQEYKRKLKKDTLYAEFETLEALDKLFSRHLASVVNDLAIGLNAQTRPAGERVANLVSLKPLDFPRFVRPDESDTWREVENREASFAAAVAIFRNEPKKDVSVGTIDGLTAQITYFEAAGGEVQRVYHGCWMGDPFNHTRLSLSGTRELILAVNHPGSSPSAVENTRSKSADYEFEGTQFRPLGRDIYDVNVRLIGNVIGGGNVLEDFHFNLNLQEDAPRIGREWNR